MNGGAIVLANINQSHMKVFNRVLNGISSMSGNNTHTRTHTRTHQVHHRPQQQKKEGEPCNDKEERSVSHRGNLNASLGVRL